MKIDPDVRRRIVLRGTAIVHETKRYEENKDNLGDVLLDLLHYADENCRDFEKELAWARKAYAEDMGLGQSKLASKATVDLFLDALAAGGTTNLGDDR